VVTADRPAGLAALTGRWAAVGIGRRVAVVTVLTGVRPVRVDCVTGRPVEDIGRPVIDGGRPAEETGRPVEANGRPVEASGRPCVASGRPFVAGRRAADGTAVLTGPAVSGFRATPGAAGRPAGPGAAAGILEAGRAVGCIMT